MRIEYASLIDKPPFAKLTSANRLPAYKLQQAKQFLQDSFDRVIQSQCILFKELNCRESFCIPDFICSTKESVLIVDAKIIPCKDAKLQQYKELVEHILWNKKDHRSVTATHLYLLIPQDLEIYE